MFILYENMNNIIYFNYSMQKKKGIDTMSLTKEKMLEIEKITADLLKDVDFEKAPYVDIVSLVKKEGFLVTREEMDIETTGLLYVNDALKNKIRLISVNTNFKNPDNEKDVVFKKSRFITAHEYGHFVLHKRTGEPIYAHRDTYHRTELLELEADYFARSILMPLEQFNFYYKLLKQLDEKDEKDKIEILSRLFQVTKNKVNKRMEDLLVLN